MLPIIVLLFIPSLVLGDKKELPSLNHDTKWLCDHHFHPVKDRMVENMVKMEICADEVNKEKATKLSNCIPSQSHSMSYFMTMCDDRQKYESVYKEWRNCLQSSVFGEDEINQIKKCAFGEEHSRPRRDALRMSVFRHETLDKFCEHTIRKYFFTHPELREVSDACMKKMYPEVYKKQQSCEKILNLRNIDVLKEVCEGKRENELNQKQNCERELRFGEEDKKKIYECIKEDLIARDWDRAARLIGITPQKSFREFCASAWAAPWGNMSDHHQTWMRVDLNEARVNLDTYVKRRNCHSINLHLACKYPDQYGEDFKKMVECEQKHKFTPEEMEKIKGNLLAEGIDPLSAQLEVTHESNLNEFCMNHRRMMVIHDHDFSKESLECAEKFQPGMAAKFEECRKFAPLKGEALRELCKDRERYESSYQEAVKCINGVKPDSETVSKIMECAINKIESRIQSEEVDKQEDSSE